MESFSSFARSRLSERLSRYSTLGHTDVLFSPPEFQDLGGLAGVDMAEEFQDLGGLAGVDMAEEFQDLGGLAGVDMAEEFQDLGGLAGVDMAEEFQDLGGLAGVDMAEEFAVPPPRPLTLGLLDLGTFMERLRLSQMLLTSLLLDMSREPIRFEHFDLAPPMGSWTGYGSMRSLMDVSLSNLRNPGSVSDFMNRVARQKNDYKRKNKELRVTAPLEDSFLGPLIEMGFSKIGKIAPTYIVLREDKSRAEEDYSQQKTTLTTANDLPEVASDVTLMQRENIASSSRPVKLICSQTPGGATLAVPTPSESPSDWKPVAAGSGDARVEQGQAEFRHSSQGFDLGPADMGNDNEAAGLQDFSAGHDFPLQSKKRSHPANESKRPPTRRRVPNFEDEEKGLLLQAKLEYLQDPANEGKRQKWLVPVTEKMKNIGYNREPKALRGQWDTLKKSFDALSFLPQGTGYWTLTTDQKKAIKKEHCHFPLTFKPEWVAAMENIEKMESTSSVEKETRRDGQEGVFSQSLASTMTDSTNFADYLEEPGDEPDSESEATDVPTDDEFSSGESGASAESHTEIASADSHGPRTEPSRKRKAASAFDEDSLFAKIRPFVNQQIEEALLPLISALRSREEDEHKHRQKMLALEREKLALMRQKLECTRRSNAVPSSVAK